MLGALPFFHVFGLTACMNFSILMGWENIIVAKPQPENLIKAITKQRPTFAPMVPTMFINILRHPDIAKADMTSIRACFSGSAPMPVEVIKEFEAITGAVILEGYGLTESSPIVCVNPFSGTRKAGSIGLPFPSTRCRIVNITDGKSDVTQGECGELIIRGSQVMKGYFNNINETEEVLKDGWLYTGDVAREGRSLTQKGLIDYCAKRLAKYKLPAKVEFRQSLPKTTIGKVLKRVLKEEEMNRSSKNSKSDNNLPIEQPVEKYSKMGRQ